MKLKFFLTLLLITVCCPLFSQASAGNGKSSGEKFTVAINGFTANNCPDSYASAVEEMLSGNIYECDRFTLFDRSQMDLILQKAHFSKEKSSDLVYATKIGKLLDVDKIIVGSVSKLDTYTIKISIINVHNSKVDFTATETAENISQFKDKTISITQQIVKFYEEGKPLRTNYSFAIGFNYLYAPLYKEDFDYGCGTTIGFTNIAYNRKIPITFQVSLYSLSSQDKSVKSLYMLPIEMRAGYMLYEKSFFSLIPSLGPGYQFSQLIYDSIKNRPGGYIYTTEYLYNPFLSLQLESQFKMYGKCSFSVAAFASAIFESDKITLLYGIRVIGGYYF